MYSSASTVVSAATTVAGAAILPNTAGNTVGRVLAITAIAVGVTALISQMVARAIKRSSAR